MYFAKPIIAVVFLLCALEISGYAEEMNASVLADQFYVEWNLPRIPGDESEQLRVDRFIAKTPPQLHAEVLARILDRACSAKPAKAWQVIGEVESILPHLDPKPKLPADLDQNLYALTKDPTYFEARIDALDTLKQLRRAQDYDTIVAALNDSNDDVRAAAFAALFGRPDADVATYQKFIQDHQSDPAYAKSVRYARSGLNSLSK